MCLLLGNESFSERLCKLLPIFTDLFIELWNIPSDIITWCYIRLGNALGIAMTGWHCLKASKLTGFPNLNYKTLLHTVYLMASELFLQLSSFAKTNPFLEIVRRESSGYHVLRSLIFPLDLSDSIRLDFRPGNGRVDIETSFSSEMMSHLVACEEESPHELRSMLLGLEGAGNLARRSVQAVLEELGTFLNGSNFDIHIKLLKRIPFGAGMGGGSSNAAAIGSALPDFLLNNFARANLSERVVAKERAQQRVCALGSDIPALLAGTAVFLLGTGNVLVSIKPLHQKFHDAWSNLGVVVLKPPCSVSTPEAYSWLGLKKGSQQFSQDSSEINFELERVRAIAQRFGFEVCSEHGASDSSNFVDASNPRSSSGLTISTSNGNSEGLSNGGLAPSRGGFDREEESFCDRFLGSLRADCIRNDFEGVVLPRLSLVSEAKRALEESGAVACFLSGSGSAVVGLFRDSKCAENVLERVESLRIRGFFVVSARFNF